MPERTPAATPVGNILTAATHATEPPVCYLGGCRMGREAYGDRNDENIWRPATRSDFNPELFVE